MLSLHRINAFGTLGQRDKPSDEQWGKLCFYFNFLKCLLSGIVPYPSGFLFFKKKGRQGQSHMWNLFFDISKNRFHICHKINGSLPEEQKWSLPSRVFRICMCLMCMLKFVLYSLKENRVQQWDFPPSGIMLWVEWDIKEKYSRMQIFQNAKSFYKQLWKFFFVPELCKMAGRLVPGRSTYVPHDVLSLSHPWTCVWLHRLGKIFEFIGGFQLSLTAPLAQVDQFTLLLPIPPFLGPNHLQYHLLSCFPLLECQLR